MTELPPLFAGQMPGAGLTFDTHMQRLHVGQPGTTRQDGGNEPGIVLHPPTVVSAHPQPKLDGALPDDLWVKLIHVDTQQRRMHTCNLLVGVPDADDGFSCLDGA